MHEFTEKNVSVALGQQKIPWQSSLVAHKSQKSFRRLATRFEYYSRGASRFASASRFNEIGAPRQVSRIFQILCRLAIMGFRILFAAVNRYYDFYDPSERLPLIYRSPSSNRSIYFNEGHILSAKASTYAHLTRLIKTIVPGCFVVKIIRVYFGPVKPGRGGNPCCLIFICDGKFPNDLSRRFFNTFVV